MNFWAKIVQIIANTLGFYLAKMPHWLFLWHIKSLAFVMRIFDRRRFKDAQANLDFVYGEEMSKEQKCHIIKTCYDNFAFVILETIRLPFIPQEKYEPLFSFVDEHYFLDTLEKDKGAVLVSAHYGYWEAMASILPPRYKWCNTASLGRLTPFNAINQMIIARRELQKVKFIDKKGAFKHLLKLYSSDNAVAGILIDQNISENEGIWVDFFGKKATHTTIASVLSRRFDVGIVPVMISINKDYKSFEVRFYPPIYCAKSKESAVDIQEATQAQAYIIEQAIRAKPEDWFWFHKRWKSAYKHIYS
ncbi:MAG: lipid A biosynthesis lauroyl acyltransferase [Helicobacter sp.]|uniref:lipid A biosynthesis lauroyl acyltransferase n=1 Tax=Helicobacter sp. TaxID=218 RepID=UPI0025C51DA5|nr:lipid A biosynthesis lauroyl acyltransferase [Helicobacter sp.]MCH5313337.1 lipid A biosynthesis lauroyl acyltransferase [Helicobacter sp.]